MNLLQQQAQDCKLSSRKLARLTTGNKDQILLNLAGSLRVHQQEILHANQQDCTLAAEAGLSTALIDRLRLSPERVEAMAAGAEQVARLADPIGKESAWTRPNGLLIRKVRVPLGVLCVIYEARPNVTIESACLAIKSGNGALLRGSRSAYHSNQILLKFIRESLVKADLPDTTIAGVADLSHESITILARMNGLIDLMIPRGGADLIKRVVETSTVPVLETGVGMCHMYVHSSADLLKAIPLIINSKCSRPAVCNALETLLLDASIAAQLLDLLEPELRPQLRVQACPKTLEIWPWAIPASSEDWHTESMAMVLNVGIVNDIDQAMDHIASHGSGHTECILTQDLEAARRFQHEVDACTVNVNASTRFTDGGEFGFGAEIGISTQKMHARGPVGLEELTTYKYLVEGQGQIRL